MNECLPAKTVADGTASITQGDRCREPRTTNVMADRVSLKTNFGNERCKSIGKIAKSPMDSCNNGNSYDNGVLLFITEY